MHSDFSTNPKSNPPKLQRQLPPEVVALLRDQEEFYRQLEREGCPPATLARFREFTRLALAKTLAESRHRDFLLREIKYQNKKLVRRRGCSNFPSDTPATLDRMRELASQLPEEEALHMLEIVARFRKAYSALERT